MDKYDESTEIGSLLIAAKAKHKHIKKPSHLADHLDISTQVLNNWRIRGIPHKEIDRICKEFSCNKEWIRTGSGNMKQETLQDEQESTLLKIFGLDDADVSLEFIQAIHELKRADKRQLVDLRGIIKEYVKQRSKEKGEE